MESADQVNNWCSDSTDGKITNIVDQIDNEINMLLINAIYFKENGKKNLIKTKLRKENLQIIKKKKN